MKIVPMSSTQDNLRRCRSAVPLPTRSLMCELLSEGSQVYYGPIYNPVYSPVYSPVGISMNSCGRSNRSSR